jgi:hypothetical protein
MACAGVSGCARPPNGLADDSRSSAANRENRGDHPVSGMRAASDASTVRSVDQTTVGRSAWVKFSRCRGRRRRPVPLRPSVRTQATARVARERDHLPAGQLSPRRVEIAAPHAGRRFGATVRPCRIACRVLTLMRPLAALRTWTQKTSVGPRSVCAERTRPSLAMARQAADERREAQSGRQHHSREPPRRGYPCRVRGMPAHGPDP